MATLNDTLLTDLKFVNDLVIKDGTGDLDTLSGLDNLRDALFRRLITSPGSLIHRPDYGVGIKDYQNAPNTLAVQRRLAVRIQEQFEQDPRVEKLLGVRLDRDDQYPDRVMLTVRVKVVGYSDVSFKFIPFGDYS